MASNCGIWAITVSLAAFLATAVVQLVFVDFTVIVALLADTIHNLGDAATSIPLLATFTLSRKFAQ